MSFRERSRIILGDAAMERLQAATVAVYGLGGVGAACALDLVRAGLGHIIVLESDAVGPSNLNRLAFGYGRFLGRSKAELFAELARDINPDCEVSARRIFISGAQAAASIPPEAELVIDAIDSLNPKVQLLAELLRQGKPCLSSMGTAGRLRPELLKAGSLWRTRGCPLARELRNRLRRLGIESELTVVWSDEEAVPPVEAPAEEALAEGRPPGRIRKIQGSLPFVPQAAGHILASLAIRRLLGIH